MPQVPEEVGPVARVLLVVECLHERPHRIPFERPVFAHVKPPEAAPGGACLGRVRRARGEAARVGAGPLRHAVEGHRIGQLSAVDALEEFGVAHTAKRGQPAELGQRGRARRGRRIRQAGTGNEKLLAPGLEGVAGGSGGEGGREAVHAKRARPLIGSAAVAGARSQSAQCLASAVAVSVAPRMCRR